MSVSYTDNKNSNSIPQKDRVCTSVFVSVLTKMFVK